MVSEMYPGQVPSHRVRVTDEERRRAVAGVLGLGDP